MRDRYDTVAVTACDSTPRETQIGDDFRGWTHNLRPAGRAAENTLCGLGLAIRWRLFPSPRAIDQVHWTWMAGVHVSFRSA